MGGADPAGWTARDPEVAGEPGRVTLVLVTAALAGIAAAAVASVIAFGPSEPAFSGVAARVAGLHGDAALANHRLLSSSAAQGPPASAGASAGSAGVRPAAMATTRECRGVRTATATQGDSFGVPGDAAVPSAWQLSGLARWPAPMRCR